MPKRKYSEVGPWKRGYGKKRKTVTVVSVPRSKFRFGAGKNANVFPKKMRQTLSYCDLWTISTPVIVGDVINYNFGANNVNDPYRPTGGHQPMGHDQLSAMYTRYMVVGAKCTVTAHMPDGTEYNSAYFGVDIAEASSGIVTVKITDHVESQYTATGLVTQNSSPMRCTLGFDAAKFFGVTNVLDNHELGALIGANPTREAYFVVWIGTPHETSAGKPVNVMVKIDYDVIYLEPKQTASS